MNAGVSTTPCGSVSFPRRAAPSVASTSNCMFRSIAQISRQDAKAPRRTRRKLTDKHAKKNSGNVSFATDLLLFLLSYFLLIFLASWRLGGYFPVLLSGSFDQHRITVAVEAVADFDRVAVRAADIIHAAKGR